MLQRRTGAPNSLASGLLDSRYELPDYSLLNGRVRYTSASGNWELTVFGNNLTDEVYGNFATRFGGAFWDTPTGRSGALRRRERSALGVTRGRPREYGITFQYNFGGGATRSALIPALTDRYRRRTTMHRGCGVQRNPLC